MEIKILDKKKEEQATCLLGKVALDEYVHSLPEDYQDFEVQRGIVTNKYLDNLVDTVIKMKHIPPIVLVADKLEEKGKVASIGDFRILDGLQRTHRLKVIWDTLEMIWEGKLNEEEGSSALLSRRNSKELREIGSNSRLFRKLMVYAKENPKARFQVFEKNYIWLEVWKGLSRRQQIEKMLLLNAGHKSVNIKHQLELLFLNTLTMVEKIAPSGVQVIREKKQSAIQYSKSREIGQYHFSHLVSSLVSLSAGKTVNTNSDFVSSLSSDETKFYELADGFDDDLLSGFLKFIHKIDKELSDKYSELGLRWVGREVVLVGLFGALGAYAREEGLSLLEAIKILDKRSSKLVSALNLKDFEKARNELELAKVNIGNVNKKAVFLAVFDFLDNKSGKSIRWRPYFLGGKDES